MIERTYAEIQNKFEELWEGSKVKIINIQEGFVVVEVQDSMGIEMNFDKLCHLSEFFGTRNIDWETEAQKVGCQTCGGYEYEVTFEMRQNDNN